MESIVVGTDGSHPAEAAVERAAELALGTGAPLHVVTAYPDVPSYRERIESSAKRESIELRDVAETVLARTVDKLTDQGIAVETHAREGDPAEVILEVAQEQKADLIVVGNRGLTGIKRFLLGSVSGKLSHHAPCSVMIVRRNT
jgi:nucleotide-binding universal stress UspA family protein